MNTGNDRPRRPGEPELGGRYIGCVIGVLGSLVLAALLVPLRDHVPNADMALALVIPVLLGATVGGRLAAIVSAITAVLVFDFVFTEPYLSLRISSKDDVATFVVFAIVALVAAGPLRTIAARSIPGFEHFEEVWAARAPLGWNVKDAEPVAGACVALLSDLFPATTGEVVHVDGGYHVVGA